MSRNAHKIAALIVAGGQGLRAGGGVAKQWRMLGSKRVVDWSVDAFRGHGGIDHIILVVPAGAPGPWPNDLKIVTGGATRAESVRAGLAAVDLPDDAIVLIHDAARPGLSRQIIDDLITALETADAAAPALPVADALKRETANGLTTAPREGLHRVQTPQAFRLKAIRQAHTSASHGLVDDLEALEGTGAKIMLTRGDIRLSKLTHPEDFDMLEKLLSVSARTPRIGSGFDVHGFEPGDHVVLCGVKIPHVAKLQGHSDADAAWHALTDAILGAAALGDIGDHFPPSDARWKNADSAIFLKEAQCLAEAVGFAISNCDITIICEAPKVKPHREAMRARTAELLGMPLDAVSVKATTTEGLGFTGRREGLAAEAVVMLVPI